MDRNAPLFSTSNNVTTAVLQFDTDGNLINQLEFSRLVAEIKEINNTAGMGRGAPITGVVLASFGWGHSLSDSQGAYLDFLRGYFQSLITSHHTLSQRWLVLCISWPSGRDTMSHSLKSVLPSRAVATAIGTPLDFALLPSTVWSSAGLADAIGAGELSDSLQYLIDRGFAPTNHPKIFLVGHSFGSRVLAGAIGVPPYLVRKFIPKTINTESNRYSFRQDIKAALFIQPAMSVSEIENIATPRVKFPLFVTQSRHDHLNGLIYPLANIPYNFSSAPVILALEDKMRGVFHRKAPDLGDATHPKAEGRTIRALNWLYDTSFETEALALTPAYSAGSLVLAPFSAIPLERMQTNSSLAMDSFAQMPLAEIPIETYDGNAGLYTKGFFNIGAYYESASRIGIPARRIPLDQLIDLLRNDQLKLEAKPFYVDCSEVINGSLIFGESINYQTNRLQNYTIGWLDPVGSHVDYEHEDIYDLIFFVLGERFRVMHLE